MGKHNDLGSFLDRVVIRLAREFRAVFGNEKPRKVARAEHKVSDATKIFEVAIKKVSDAQDLLSAEVAKDVRAIEAKRSEIKLKEVEIEQVETDKKAKGDTMYRNSILLRNLKQFTDLD